MKVSGHETLSNSMDSLRNVSLLLIFSMFSLVACAHPISESFRSRVDSRLSFQQIMDKTDQHLGKNVIFGGVIIAARNFENRAEVEVIQKELDGFGYPSREDETQGRFIFVKEGFLDPEIWSKGRYVTGAGQIKGTQTGKIDNKEYSYPLIEAAELKLWENYNYSPYYGPFYSPYYYYGYGFGRFRYFGSRNNPFY